MTYLSAATLLFTAVCLGQTSPSKGVTKVTSVEDPSKSTIMANITYLVGSRHEGTGEGGMAHLPEHMVFKGSPKHINIPQELTEHGARPDGTTWEDRTNCFETFKATDENVKWELDLERDLPAHHGRGIYRP
jgi:zinc protease